MSARNPKSRYSSPAAGQFWTKRLRSTTPLQAVLGYSTPPVLNEAYDLWERSVLRKALERLTARTQALDLACGTGRITSELLSAGATVTAVDIAAGMLEYVRKRHRAALRSGSLNLIQAGADRLPFSDASFDLITCCGLFEHLPALVRRRALYEISRLLTRRGRALIVINNADAVFLQSRYPMLGQDHDGYFVGLVGRAWLDREAARIGRKTALLAANPLSAVLAELARELPTSELSSPAFRQLCRQSIRIDATTPPDQPSSRLLASHFLIALR